MKWKTIRGYEKLRDIFEDSLTVDLLAEELYACALEDDALYVHQELEQYDFDIMGVLDEGKLVGYVRQDELSLGRIADYYHPFTSDELISDSTTLLELLPILEERDYVFLLEKNQITKIVTIADLHKQPIRMLIFSLISLLEMYLTEAIRELHPNGEWKEKITDNRLEKAQEVWVLRKSRNEELTLLDNTQLGDKGSIVKNTPELLEQLGFSSKTKCGDFFSSMERLRNNTVHAQEMIYDDNHELIEVILQINQMLERISKV